MVPKPVYSYTLHIPILLTTELTVHDVQNSNTPGAKKFYGINNNLLIKTE